VSPWRSVEPTSGVVRSQSDRHIPCFSLVQKHGGKSFGGFKPDQTISAKRAVAEFLAPRRVMSMHAPRYGTRDELGSLLRAAVANRCQEILLQRQQACG